MRQASEYVLAGFPLRTDKEVILDRFPVEERGQEMWSWMTETLAVL